MTDSSQMPAATGASAKGQPAQKSNPQRHAMVVAAAGVLLTVAAIGLVVRNSALDVPSGDPARPTLAFVAQSDLSAAASTLTQSAAGALIEDAQRCRVPLVSMTIERGSAAPGSTIRIRSGSYISPYFAVTDAMQRFAVPYPEPYGSGSGTFVVEGNATGAILGLTPTKVMVGLPEAQRIPVVWHPVSPC